MKRYIPIAAIALSLLAAPTPALAIDASDGAKMDEAIKTVEPSAHRDTIALYVVTKGEPVYMFKGAEKDKFIKSLAGQTGYTEEALQAGGEVAQVMVAGNPDPADGTVMCVVFRADNSFIGAMWLPKAVIDKASEAATASI